MFVVICEYEGHRHSNPLELYPPIEAIGPFEYKEAIEYEAEHRYEGCSKHSVVPLIGTN